MKRPSQLDLGFDRRHEPDRNSVKGGKSFYFFDLDDNVLHLKTPIYLYDTRTGEERPVSTGEFADLGDLLGQPGPYEFYQIRADGPTGSFRRFRQKHFIKDMKEVLDLPDFQWKGPSWSCFEYAVHNERPVALITARGHPASTLRAGISLLVKAGFLSREPNYLEIYAVSHPATFARLCNGNPGASTAVLKKQAIFQCVEAAMARYGANPHHRFGMSDDDPKNIALITEAKKILKARYPQNAFFVIHAGTHPVVKDEIFCDHILTTAPAIPEQLQFEF